MKNLKKISRENLKNVKGGITEECARAQATMTCFSSLSACQANIDPNLDELCIQVCNKYCR
ncbi:hypothetical protein QE422_000804 [Chryseobacterium sp. SORGH_AS 447]|uniref:bacteriocin-like protein n=1 Tax=Chryseobacterium sp. SORGH_AS_0447 TaxID=3041769 RepID=UPI002789205D|nr:hypothetical protein [Chryseobacterium sp. SORGH_AS_0447]MDQ1160436.1 hypothetical protein [Chryseobacterium sp. SORGH_AS_0447]